MGSYSARPRITDRTKLADQLILPPGAYRVRDELITERQARVHGDARVVAVEMLYELRANVVAFPDVDPSRRAAERIDAGLLGRVQPHGARIERRGGGIASRP